MLICHVLILLAIIALDFKVAPIQALRRQNDYDGSQSFEFSGSYEPDVINRHNENHFYKSKSWSGESLEFQKQRRPRIKTVKVDVKVSIPVHHHHHHHDHSYEGWNNAIEKRTHERNGNRNGRRNRKEPAKHNNRQHPAKHGRGIVPSKKQNVSKGDNTNEKAPIPTTIAPTEYVTERTLLSTAPAGNHEPLTEKTFAIVTTQTPRVEFNIRTEPTTDNPILVTEKEHHHITSTTEKEISKTTKGTTISTMHPTTEKLITIPTTTENSHVEHSTAIIHITTDKPHGRVMEKAHQHTTTEEETVETTTPRSTPPPVAKRRHQRKHRPTEKSAPVDHVDQVEEETKAPEYYLEGEDYEEIVHITHAPVTTPPPRIAIRKKRRFKLKKRVDGKEGVDIKTVTNSPAGSSWSWGADHKQGTPDIAIQHKTEVVAQPDSTAPASHWGYGARSS